MVRCILICGIFASVWIGTPSQALPFAAHEQNNVKEIFVPGRIKRSTVVGALLKTARLIQNSKSFRLYTKSGGNEQALKDLRSLKPTSVEEYGSTHWAKVGSGITERKARVETMMGKTTLTIWKNTLSKEGRLEISVDKIIYL